MSPNGQFLYVAAEDSGEVYAFSRNTSTGALTRSSTPKLTGLSGALDVQVDSQNKFLFASYINAVEVMSIGSDGSPRISPVSAFSTNNSGQGSGPHSMVIHPNGQSLCTANINAHADCVQGRSGERGAHRSITQSADRCGSQLCFYPSERTGSILDGHCGQSSIQVYD